MTSSGSGAGIQNTGNFSQQTGSASTANLEEWKTIMDAKLKQNDVKIQDLQKKLEEKSEEIDGIQSTSNATLKRYDIKIQNLQIELDNKSKEIEEIRSKSNITWKLNNLKVDKLQIGLDNKSKAVTDLETTIDEKFQRLEQKFNAELEKSEGEIGKIRNDTTENSEKIEENRKSFGGILNWPRLSCSNASRSNVYSWDGRGGIVQLSREGKFYEVYCDVTTDGGGWTTFQKRIDGSIDFYRTWEEYAEGFGNKLGEFWLGLENVYQLTQDGAYELRVELRDWDGSTAYAKYGTFSISGRSDNYRLAVGQYSGTAGDAMTSYQNGQSFSAKDRDLDGRSSVSCATILGGAWWYGSCAHSSLNGRYNDTSVDLSGVFWYNWGSRTYYSLKGSEMKFRRK